MVISSLVAFVTAILSLILSEVLRAMIYGKNTIVEIYRTSSRLFLLYSMPRTPISKFRYIFALIAPYIIFVLIPFIIWYAMPHIIFMSDFISSFFLYAAFFYTSSDIKIYIAFRHMPKGSMYITSGLDAYWFMPHST